MNLIAYAVIILGYGLLYTGISDFSGNTIGLFQAFGYTGTKAPTIDSNQYKYNSSATANLTGQPAQFSSQNGTGISGVKAV